MKQFIISEEQIKQLQAFILEGIYSVPVKIIGGNIEALNSLPVLETSTAKAEENANT